MESVTWFNLPKGAKDKVKGPEGPLTGSQALGGPPDVLVRKYYKLDASAAQYALNPRYALWLLLKETTQQYFPVYYNILKQTMRRYIQRYIPCLRTPLRFLC